MLEQHTSMAVGDGFGISGSSRGIQNPHGMVEIHRGETELGYRAIKYGVPLDIVADGTYVLLMAEIRDNNHLLEGGNFFFNRCYHFHSIKGFAAILVSIHSNQNFWVDLTEPVKNAVDSKVGRAARPNGSQTVGGQKTYRGSWNIGYKPHDTIPRLDTGFLEKFPEVGSL